MNTKILKAIALLAMLGVAQLNVLASPPLMGRLKTRDNKPISVNSAAATSGATIMSGAQIQCPDKVGATVEIPTLGRIDIAPKSDLTLNFESNKITVELRSGYALLTTNAGIIGTINTLEGNVFATDPLKTSSVMGKTSDAEGPETAVGAGSGNDDAKLTGILGAAAAIIGGSAGSKSGRGRNLSTDNPRAPQ